MTLITDEEFGIRLEGGKYPGDYSSSGMSWPLPDEIPSVDKDGAYVKYRQSEKHTEDLITGELRGAWYRWAPKEEKANELSEKSEEEVSQVS